MVEQLLQLLVGCLISSGQVVGQLSDWLPVRDFFPGIYLVLDVSSSGKQQGRPGLPNCGFVACDGVSLAMADCPPTTFACLVPKQDRRRY